VEKIFGDVVDPTGEYLNIKRGITTYLKSTTAAREQFLFSQKPDKALENYVLISGAFMDKQKFTSTYLANGTLPGNNQLKKWIYEKSGRSAMAVRRGQAQMAIWLYKLAALASDRIPSVSWAKKTIYFYNDVFGESSGRYIPTMEDVIQRMEDRQKVEYQNYLSLFRQGNLKAQDFLELEGTNALLCYYLVGKEKGQKRPRGKIEEYTLGNGKTGLRLYTYTQEPNAVKEIAEIGSDKKLKVIRWIKAEQATQGADNKPQKLLSQNVTDDPVTYLTKNPNGELGFYSDIASIQGLITKASKAVEKGLKYYFKVATNKQLTQQLIAEGNDGIISEEEQKRIQPIDWNVQVTNESLSVNGPNGHVITIQKALEDFYLNAEDATKNAFKEACKCITDPDNVSRACARSILQVIIKDIYEQPERVVQSGVTTATAAVAPVVVKEGLTSVLLNTILKNTFANMGVSRTIGSWVAIVGQNDLLLTRTIPAFVEVLKNQLATAVTTLNPWLVFGVVAAIVVAWNYKAIKGAVNKFIDKIKERFKKNCDKYKDLAEKVVCVFEPHLGDLNQPSGQEGLKIAQEIIVVNGEENVINLITKRRKDLVKLIKGLSGRNNRYPSSTTKFLKDLGVAPSKKEPKLLDPMLSESKDSTKVLLDVWKKLINIDVRANLKWLTSIHRWKNLTIKKDKGNIEVVYKQIHKIGFLIKKEDKYRFETQLWLNEEESEQNVFLQNMKLPYLVNSIKENAGWGRYDEIVKIVKSKSGLIKVIEGPIIAKSLTPQPTGERYNKKPLKIKNGYIYKLEDGKWILGNYFTKRGKQKHVDFVVRMDTTLVIGDGHYNLADEAKEVLAAGRIKIVDGKIVNITNNSGHYKPNQFELQRQAKILDKMGLTAPDRKISPIKPTH